MSETNPTGHIKISKLDALPLSEIKDGDKLIIPVSNDISNNGTPQWASYSVSTSVLTKFIGNNLELDTASSYGVKIDRSGDGKLKVNVTPGQVTNGNSYVVTGGEAYTAINSTKTEIIGNIGDAPDSKTVYGAKRYADSVASTVKSKFPVVTSESGSGIYVNQSTDATGKTTYKVSKADGVFYYLDNKLTLSELPSTDNTIGDVWSVGPAHATGSSLYVWDGDEWIKMGGANGTIDIDTTASKGVALAKNTNGTIKVNVTTGSIADGDDLVVTANDVYSYINNLKGSAVSTNGSYVNVKVNTLRGEVSEVEVTENSYLYSAVPLANSAVQSVEVLGKTLDKTKNSLTVEEAKSYLGLKGAAYKETSDFDAAGAADAVKKELIGNRDDDITTTTIYGAQNYTASRFHNWNYSGRFDVGTTIPVNRFLSKDMAAKSLVTPIMYSYLNPSTKRRQNYTMIWRDYNDNGSTVTFSFAFFDGTSIVKKVLTLNEAGDAWTVTA